MDDLSDDRIRTGRSVTARRCRDLDSRASVGFEHRGAPRREPPRAGAEATSTSFRGDDRAHLRQQLAAGPIKVVFMMVVAQQHRVDRDKLRNSIDGPCSLRDAVPQPKKYLLPGGSNVGSVISRHGPISMTAVGPPT
jgi:hypothetical protein